MDQTLDQKRNRLENLMALTDPLLQETLSQTVKLKMWPTGACTFASIVLAPFLRMAADPDFRVAVGRGHAWLESPEFIVDPTYQQFEKTWPKAWGILSIPAETIPSRYIPRRRLTLPEEQEAQAASQLFYSDYWGYSVSNHYMRALISSPEVFRDE